MISRHGPLGLLPLARSRCTGVQRTTFIVDSEGRIAQVLGNVKPAQHDKLVLAALEGYDSSVI